MDKAIKVGNAEIKLGVECNYIGCSDKRISINTTLFEKDVKVVLAVGNSCSSPCGYTLYYNEQPILSAYVFVACNGTPLERLVVVSQMLRSLISDEEFDKSLQTYSEDYTLTHFNSIKLLNNLVSDMVRVKTAPPAAE